MAKETFYLDSAKKEELVIEWVPGYKSATVFLNEQEIGQFENIQEMIRGKSFTEGLGDTLEIKMGGKPYKFEITYGGIHIDGSSKHPKKMVKALSSGAIMLAIIYLLFGVIAYLVSAAPILDLIYSGTIAVLILGCTLMMRKGYILGFVGIVFFVVIDVLLNVLVMIELGMPRGLGWLTMKIVIVGYLVKGYKEVLRLNEHNRIQKEREFEF
jgi:hypothetical protein